MTMATLHWLVLFNSSWLKTRKAPASTFRLFIKVILVGIQTKIRMIFPWIFCFRGHYINTKQLELLNSFF